MDFGLSMTTMRKFKFGPESGWNSRLVQSPESERLPASKNLKMDREMSFMQYDPSHVGKDAGEFVRVQTKTRLNLLKAAKQAKGESVLDNSVLNLGNQVITTNLGYKKSKKRKNYYNRYSKPVIQNKPKFETIAQIRSEWKEIAKIGFPDSKKDSVEVEKTVLSQAASAERTFAKAFLKNRKKNFQKIRVQEQGFIPPHDVQADEELMGLFESEDIAADKVGVFISENALYTIGAINLSKFPFVLKARREGNKILVWYEMTPENCFMFWESYRESTSENYIESEKKLQKLSMESTQILEAFQTKAISPPDRSFEKKKGDMSKEDFEKKQKQASDVEFKRRENSRVVKFWLNESVVVYSRMGLEGTDAHGKEILVKALYDMPKLLNNKNKGGDVFLDCVQYNSFRITKWMVHAYFNGEHLRANRRHPADLPGLRDQDQAVGSVPVDQGRAQIAAGADSNLQHQFGADPQKSAAMLPKSRHALEGGHLRSAQGPLQGGFSNLPRVGARAGQGPPDQAQG